MRVLCINSDYTGCGYYRIIEPYSNIISEIDFVINKEPEILTEVALAFDAVIFQRPLLDGLDNLIGHLKENGKKVVVETDDDLLNIPADNPVNLTLNQKYTYRMCLDLADAVHVSTEELKDSLPPSIKNKTTVFHNAIDIKKYDKAKEMKYISWTGSVTHKDSLEIIKPVINDLVKSKHHVLLSSNKQWLNNIGFYESEYLTIEAWQSFDEQHRTHERTKINLAPLNNNKFNRQKSELRLLESAVYGVPSVATDIAPYNRFNSFEEGSVLVKNKYQDWMGAIEKLLHDEKYYKEKSVQSLETVQRHYNLKIVNEKREQWWKNFIFAS